MKTTLFSTVAFLATQMLSAQCSELFFSEYVEGSGNDKALEIYNPTSASVNLSQYSIVRYSNGSASGVDSLQLTGTLAPNAVHVVVNGQTVTAQSSPACSPALQALATQLAAVYPDPLYFNGDDAVALKKNGVIIDLFGKIGEDPGTAWTNTFPYTGTGTWLTANHTLVRKPTVTAGVLTNPAAFDALVEWDTLANNFWGGLGSHTSSCATSSINEEANGKLSVYPNPSVNGALTLATDKNMNAIQFVSLSGQIVKEINLENPTTEFKVNNLNLSTGIYFVRITLENKGVLIKKISVN